MGYSVDIIKLRSTVRTRHPEFGPNKQQELVRLLFEIAVRDKIEAVDLLAAIPKECSVFPAIKEYLERRRYPEATARGIQVHGSLAAVDIDPEAECDLSRPLTVYPRKIFIERETQASALVARLRGLFPASGIEVIERYRDHVKEHACGPVEFNRRLESFYVINEHYDFFKPCPCTPGVVSCGYHNVNLGFGCPFECSYCFLQNYTNAPGIVFPANIDDFFTAFTKYDGKAGRLGSGETTDSLAFDHITGFAPRIVDFFRDHPKTMFEFKTKSDNIDGLLSVPSASNIVAAWSVNPQCMIDREEFYTASLLQRLDAARRCAAAGYRTAFHFDPVFYYPGWQKDYAEVITALFTAVPAESIAWISVGTLRMTIRQKKMIENRFPCNTILSSELVTAVDGKVRYLDDVREETYRFMVDSIRSCSARVPVYLCMETADMWRRLGLKIGWPYGG